MTQEEIAVKLGMGREFVKAVKIVFSDEYREKYFANMPAKLTKAGIKTAVKQWNKIREMVLAGKVTVYAAMKEIRDARKEVAGKKLPTPKPKKMAGNSADDESARTDEVMQWLVEEYDFNGSETMKVDGEFITELTVSDVIAILVAFARRD
jgi:hypothetical protein